MHFRTMFKIPATLLVTALLVLAGCAEQEGQPGPAGGGERPPMPVTVRTMTPQTVPVSVEATGQTQGSRQIEVRAQVEGILLERLYEEGAVVAAGQPLFRIDPSDYEVAVDQARARAAQTKREVRRLAGLIEQNAVSRYDYDNAVSANAIAQAALRQAELDLSRTTVRAPIAGIAGLAHVSEGSLITNGDDSLLTTLVQTDPMWVNFSVAQREVDNLPGSGLGDAGTLQIELLMPDGTRYGETGQLNYLDAGVDERSGSRRLRAAFANPEGRLLPGEFVTARVQLPPREGVFLVPQAAVLQSEHGHMVMLADEENKVTPRPVQVAEWHGDEWVVTGGLQKGERVIVDNLIKLRPGAVVAPQPEGGDAAPADAAQH